MNVAHSWLITTGDKSQGNDIINVERRVKARCGRVCSPSFVLVLSHSCVWGCNQTLPTSIYSPIIMTVAGCSHAVVSVALWVLVQTRPQLYSSRADWVVDTERCVKHTWSDLGLVSQCCTAPHTDDEWRELCPMWRMLLFLWQNQTCLGKCRRMQVGNTL